ncbi:copper-binding protein [Billgrantia desiderata]|uniref:copper-binding protein n=1 Tax=Billgrantia desiderata TaxID=52021 RepID=UPI001F1871F6|nr:copper-binding protein [Halomonas desiderata]MCE8012676.1 copper-binding protein [Halomonas desiderata]
MKNSMLQLVVVMGLIMAAPAVASSDHGHGKHAAHGAQAGHEHQEMRTAEGVGIVQSIAQDGSSVLVAHEPITELRWPAMTMELALADPALAELVNTEDQIIFVLRQTGETDYEIVSLETID